MRISEVTLRHVDMPFRAPFKTSRWVQRSKEAVLVEVRAEGLSGWGECVALSFPDYCYECTATNWLVLKDFIVPAVLGLRFETVDEVLAQIAHITGHPMARAGLETAIWDLLGQRDGVSLQRLLGGSGDRVKVGVSVGIHETPWQLLDAVNGYLAEGYRRIKVKIKPGHDLDDIVDHAKLQPQLKTALCLDESILSLRHARWAAELGACRIINIKPGRVGGLTEARRIHDFCRQQGMPVWMGGMYETGIGRATNVAVASLPGFTLPGDISASSKYFFEDIIDAPFTLNADSTLSVPQGPGLGVRIDRKALDKVTLRCETLRAATN